MEYQYLRVSHVNTSSHTISRHLVIWLLTPCRQAIHTLYTFFPTIMVSNGVHDLPQYLQIHSLLEISGLYFQLQHAHKPVFGFTSLSISD